MLSISYLENEKISQLIKQSPYYQKSAKTLLRKPKNDELGKEFSTYVKDNNELRKESLNIISFESIIARNEQIIGLLDNKEVYNEWLIPNETVVKNYGQEVFNNLTIEFVAYKKKALTQALLITEDILKELKITGELLPIKVDWSQEPMMAKIGDYLTSGGYSISAHDMKDYELIKQ